MPSCYSLIGLNGALLLRISAGRPDLPRQLNAGIIGSCALAE